jgi:precorrin-2 dehydrogenase/sirohydrochlorin ferrochelatase
VLCNVVDRPAAGTFTLPSVVRRGDLVLTVATSGQSPALAKRLRKELEGRFGIEYEGFLRLMGAVRQRLLEAGHDPETHRKIFTELVDADLPAAIRDGRWGEARRRLIAILGPGYDDALLYTAGAPADWPARQGQP